MSTEEDLRALEQMYPPSFEYIPSLEDLVLLPRPEHIFDLTPNNADQFMFEINKNFFGRPMIPYIFIHGSWRSQSTYQYRRQSYHPSPKSGDPNIPIGKLRLETREEKPDLPQQTPRHLTLTFSSPLHFSHIDIEGAEDRSSIYEICLEAKNKPRFQFLGGHHGGIFGLYLSAGQLYRFDNINPFTSWREELVLAIRD